MARTADDYVRQILQLEGVLRAFLHRFAPKPSDLDDLLQETYSRLLGLPADQRGSVRNVQAFSLTSARHVAVDWIRHKRVVSMDLVEDMDDLPFIEDAGSLDDIVSTHQQLLQVADAVATLPERCREVFTLRRVYGLSQKEIGRRLGISDQTVEQHLVQGMRRCAKLLDADVGASQAQSGWIDRWLHKRKRKEHHG